MRLLIGALLVFSSVQAEELRITSWNLESGGESATTTLAEQISQLPQSDIWTFQEVRNRQWADEIMWGIQLHGGDYDYQLSSGGREERLMIVYNRARVDLLEKKEMRNLNDGGHRDPLAATMIIKATGQKFYLLVNHLARQKTSLRHKQATGLNEWADKQELPVIATGVYNFDWKVKEGERKHDETFDVLTDADVFRWVRPEILIRTQNTPSNEVQDFVFISGFPENWKASSEIVMRPNDFPDNDETSDHRPVVAQIVIE